ncbi:MAG TPA: sodium:solute symporter [Cryomorphaceae bacterium]|nr:sodium:solute symporter [Owenweeksia sp.]MBF97529.1 sodium:solute symporter [Owenweeksia sp.]HAD96080.1 sodium:solute symporter [Cryomorphaceae bacterium]|tara:strand:- start:2720 stop:4441 length:1722 start_codon:yes stop_codon:yes gene_type:complete
MSTIDWIVLFGTLFTIVGYGTWRTRKAQTADDYLRGGNEMNWLTIGLSVMATQASAITFLSAPGLGYEKGLRFVQFYFGLPLALIIISAFIIPIYYRLKVYTAYEYLESRFDLKTRLLAAFLFLVQRGLAAGLTIYAPAIILSSILGWNLNFTNLFVGLLVIIYTVSGGSKAVSLTQKWQMAIILLGMVLAFGILLFKIGDFTSFGNAMHLAGSVGRLEILDFDWNLNERYTVWSGLTGGLFLALSYFGTDQSQVQRYLTGRNIKESRLGLMFNAMLKIPMQLFILFTGVLVFVFYLYVKPPVFFNETALEGLDTSYAEQKDEIQAKYDANYLELQAARQDYSDALAGNGDAAMAREKFRAELQEDAGIRQEVKELLLETDPDFKIKDTNYVFLTFVMDYLPIGVIGLIIALIFSAAMSSTSGELNALATTTSVDFYRRLFRREASEKQQIWMSRLLTVLWGALAIGFALSASLFDNLIEMVNLLGSLFYGTILGIFVVAFFIKWIKASAVFWSAIIAELCVLAIHFGRQMDLPFFRIFDVEYLWYNVIGCVLVVVLAVLFQAFRISRDPGQP